MNRLWNLEYFYSSPVSEVYKNLVKNNIVVLFLILFLAGDGVCSLFEFFMGDRVGALLGPFVGLGSSESLLLGFLVGIKDGSDFGVLFLDDVGVGVCSLFGLSTGDW